jgi:hypothetical protein
MVFQNVGVPAADDSANRTPIDESSKCSRDNVIHPPAQLVIVVTPVSGRAGVFAASLEGTQTVLCKSRTPLLEAARVLIAAGYHPRIRLKMRHCGAEHFALEAKLGDAAGLVVEESAHGPKFRCWRKVGANAAERPAKPDLDSATKEAPLQAPIPPVTEETLNLSRTGSPSAVDAAGNAQMLLPLWDATQQSGTFSSLARAGRLK